MQVNEPQQIKRTASMSNMNARTRKKLRPILVKRDGPYCNDCGKRGSFAAHGKYPLLLVIDHIDNDNGNNDLANLQLLCRSCNGLKNPRGRYAKPAKQPRDKGEIPFTMRRGLEINKSAKAWMSQHIVDDVSLIKDEVVQRLAFVTDATIVTTERWLKKAVVNEEPECRYRVRMDDDENVWIELKPEYRKVKT